MSEHNFKSALNFTSRDFETEILDRFRAIVGILPLDCKLSREPWGSSTVLALDFSACIYHLEIVKENSAILLDALQQLGMGKSVIFRHGSHVKAFRHV